MREQLAPWVDREALRSPYQGPEVVAYPGDCNDQVIPSERILLQAKA